MDFNGTFYDLINNIFIGFLLWGLCDLTYPIEPNMTIFIPLYILGLIYCKLCERTLGQNLYLQPIITQYFIDNKSEIWLLFLIAHSKR